MAFGFLGDIVEGVADIFLPEKGTRGATLGGAIGSVFGPTGTAVGSVVGSGLSQGLSAATASGGAGQGATTTPTPAQSPQLAPETAVSSQGPNVYRPSFAQYEAAGVPLYASTNLPSTITKPGAVGMAETILDVAYNVGQSWFGGSNVCAATPKKLVSQRMHRDGSMCLTVTRKQQHQLKQMVQYMGIEGTADYVGLSVQELAALLVKKFPPRRKGISAAQLRTAKRVNRQIMGMAKQLTDSCKTTTRRR